MIKLDNCPVCNQTSFSNFISCKDYTVSQETFTIVCCNNCKFKFTNPIPNEENLNDYYQSKDYISHSNTKEGLVAKVYHLVRNYTLKRKLKLLNQLVSRGTILDYGCGTGAFLSVCKQDNWQAFGIEPDKGARRQAENNGSKVYNSKENLLLNNPNLKFEAITMWHVLEHIVDLNSTLSLLSNSLKDSGVLVFALPNYKSYDAKYYNKYWAAYDVPRHLYHFDKSAITNLISKNGFEFEKMKPMYFDSFYVSMLSEKYKHGKNKFINALIIGFISNLKAFFSKEHSSQIYVFRKK
jgi:2-polyprenyl-3-methyl-5-hydroxy-6-metoxy-1,4-benzoquinol methylase